ncbi:MAG: TIGR03960 family B12-binding radical SAM protein [Deferribacteraceae bacterium]|jgi:radical SAM family uncharacterized protein/radical SAM-linked protein|nr:TIGR03960 family B12-binding radical SAM protein [Deferribacteraceae bacterium]
MRDRYSQLLSISKPLRYAGGEIGEIRKDPKGKLTFCLVFPDIYEIGMSHTGFRIIYSRLNGSSEISAERFFAPWYDAWQKLGGEIMVSLEHRRRLNQFDVIGFSLQYEMAYTTVIQLLKMSAIPIKSAERGENDPVIIAGGGCVMNPAPLAEFIDVFFLGEMDKALVPVMEKLHEMRQNGASKREQLEMLNSYPFTYIPLVEHNKKVKREIYHGFSADTELFAPLVPFMPVVQDRVNTEIARGCSGGCRFCQAGIIYRPVREKNVPDICKWTFDMLNATGHQEVALLSLDTGNYSQIGQLLNLLGNRLNARKISLSLPSLRAGAVTKEMLNKVGAVRKPGFTIAPEAGSQRLRNIINKNLTDEEIINAAVYAKNANYNGVKLYFMCGLPYETDDDILGIAALVRKIREAVKHGKYFDITVSVSNFVPKPHTPFERFGQAPPEELRRRHNILKNALKRDKIKLKFHDITTSLIEAAFSRGDSRWGVLLKDAADKGFYLDAWSEYFSGEAWLRLFDDNGFTPEEFACREMADGESAPWNMTDCGISPQWLRQEYDKAAAGVTTDDCRTEKCTNCGVCDFKTVKNINSSTGAPLETEDKPENRFAQYKLTFERDGVSILFSALDSIKVFSHLLLFAGVKLKYTEGFNPLPRIVLPSPLPVGAGGTEEILFFEGYIPHGADKLPEMINSAAPDGLKVISVKRTFWSGNLSYCRMTFKFDQESFLFLRKEISGGRALYQKTDKKGRLKTVCLSDYLLETDEENCSVKIAVTEKGSFHFPDFFKKAGYDKIPVITRTSLTLTDI